MVENQTRREQMPVAGVSVAAVASVEVVAVGMVEGNFAADEIAIVVCVVERVIDPEIGMELPEYFVVIPKQYLAEVEHCCSSTVA